MFIPSIDHNAVSYLCVSCLRKGFPKEELLNHRIWNENLEEMASASTLTPSLTTRISMRWGKEAPFESTDTLVITLGEWYVDLRVDKGTGKIDWALAGECTEESQNPRMIPESNHHTLAK